ncbi:MAG: metallophosphoesterase [Lachnospiraceae bacterium]|nr:metallophosphoesterase [Lachnospiraceae bacterium]
MTDFKVTKYRIRVENGKRGPDTPYSAVFLSDLHNASYGEDNSRLLSEIRNADPQLVFAAGDMLTSSKEPQMDAAIALMNELTRKYPVYYVNGNHESRMRENTEDFQENYEKYVSAIRSYGVHLLENSAERLEIRHMPLCVWGLELPLAYYGHLGSQELTADKVEEFLGKPSDDCYQILLSHNPCFFDAYASWGADLTLSGHLHGGIIRLPLLGGVISPQMRLFPKYDRGLFSQEGKKLIVSAGLGSHTVNIRINNPPELIVLDFV